MINGNNFYTPSPETRILIAPLDWGLGHATRCIPIIKHLISEGCEVFIAASGSNYFLLKKEFPTTVILRVNSYKIRYSRQKKWLPIILFFQFPKIIFSVIKENLWLKKIIKKHSINAVISDNRFGMYSHKIPSVYITHQLSIKTGNRFTESIAKRIHANFIKKYKYCWVPDRKENGLAGELSHQQKIPRNTLYIGPLSRFEILENVSKKFDVLISISGPEPQRTLFENQIFFQLQNCRKKILLVRGLPEDHKELISKNPFVEIVNHLSADELNLAIQESEIVICRSGYTSVMDLVKLGKTAILIPTPGQTEQEYLANYLMEKKLFYSVKQDKFSMETSLNIISSFDFISPSFSMNEYKIIISEFVQSLKSGNFANQ